MSVNSFGYSRAEVTVTVELSVGFDALVSTGADFREAARWRLGRYRGSFSARVGGCVQRTPVMDLSE